MLTTRRSVPAGSPRRRWKAAAAALVASALLLAACSDGGQSGGRSGSAEGAGSPEEVPSALEDMRDQAFPAPLIDPDLVQSGGPPPDGIPAIDDPQFESARDVEWLDDEEPVLSLTVNDETRAYPLQVMTWHEIVNDTVGGTPVAVTYCPLCNSGVAFERQTAGRLLSFGTSGRLYNDNLVMYDRQTESLWPQLTGQASIGVLTGTQLTAIPMGTVAWEDFRTAHPAASVLSRNTGYDRPYGRNPYVGYDDPDSSPLFGLSEPTDPRLPVKARVVGIDVGGERVAVARDRLARNEVTSLSVGGVDLVVFHAPGQASALDAYSVAGGADIGTVAVYRARLEGKDLAFVPRDDGFVDTSTGSRWTVLGRAEAGPLRGSQLTAVRFLDTFWFAWVAFHPDSDVVR
jgi:hypothetical protein